MSIESEERIALLVQTLADRQVAYNALGSSGAGWQLVTEIRDLQHRIYQLGGGPMPTPGNSRDHDHSQWSPR